MTGTSGSETLTGGSGDDSINGNAGNDIIFGGGGNDSIKGGIGADIITSGSGTDTITLRSGDGGPTIADADTVTDFTDGSDLIGFDSGDVGGLNITQGTGSNSSDTVIKITSTGEFLALLQNVSASSINIADFVNTSITPITIAGGGGDDILLGGSGNDTIQGNAGNDQLFGASGDDILLGSIGTDTFTGGAGSDAFNVEISDASSTSTADVLKDFTVSQSDTITLLESGAGLTNSNLRGDGTKFQSGAFDVGNGTALSANTGFFVNTSTANFGLTISDVTTSLSLGIFLNAINANDSFFYVTDDGLNSGVFKFSDQNGNADVDSGEVVAIAILENVSDATVITEDLVTDFIL